MLLEKAGCVFMGLIVYLSVIQGQEISICALKGSSVDLPCSAQHPTSSMKWFTLYWDGEEYILNNLSADGNHVTYNMLEKSNFTLTIKDVTESDANVYCCKETTDKLEICIQRRIQLHVADLQVKVIPSTEGQTVTLMCSTSCPLTEHPAGYIWYKNREFLYQDWSPWYQQLVSSEEAVTYSCAVRGYEDLRAPEVSVDSVTPTCFTVTYAKGSMCSYNQTSEDERCSITYSREVHVQRSPSETTGDVTLTCNTSCPPTTIIWYKNRQLIQYKKPQYVPNTSEHSFSCALKGSEELRSDEVCVEDGSCLIVNYDTRRICAVEKSSVKISSQYSYAHYHRIESKCWYKTKINGKGDAERLIEAAGKVEYHDDNMKKQHILKIHNLRKSDSAEYTFKPREDGDVWRQYDLPGVTLVVTGLKVKFSPSAEVTEGQRVTLTCSTITCPLPDNTNYIWFFNSRPLNLTENQNKRLVLDPVSSQHAGNYSCVVETPKNTRSHESTLTVLSRERSTSAAAAAGVGVVLLVIIPLAAFLWIRKKRTSSKSPRTETSHNMEQLNPGHVYEDISPQPTEQDDSHYSQVNFPKNNTDIIYSTVQPHPPQDPELAPYAVVNL